ncbi:lasso peptide biosynthesis PqqD family chaperone [Actinomadura roseirufa]|uniref:lasso peptide biosynthesis PqqD family chaperone n=1 Tax=Actinomadura roseirufa TaxID=2094049 RepID=UPI0010415102|nr:lasso peptide biosynthesis PqqD family chaperone [Actinomadura roseirufa]
MKTTLAPHVRTVDTEHGMVLLDERSGRYWQLNATAATVVRLLMEGAGADAAIKELTRRHASAADRVADDVRALLRSLEDAGMVAR